VSQKRALSFRVLEEATSLLCERGAGGFTGESQSFIANVRPALPSLPVRQAGPKGRVMLLPPVVGLACPPSFWRVTNNRALIPP